MFEITWIESLIIKTYDHGRLIEFEIADMGMTTFKTPGGSGCTGLHWLWYSLNPSQKWKLASGETLFIK